MCTTNDRASGSTKLKYEFRFIDLAQIFAAMDRSYQHKWYFDGYNTPIQYPNPNLIQALFKKNTSRTLTADDHIVSKFNFAKCQK